MPRQQTVVNTMLLQSIINQEQATKQWTKQMAFFTECARQYNLQCPLEPITASVIYLRYKNGLVSTTVRKGRIGREKGVQLSATHKEALQAGARSRGKGVPAMDAKAVALLRSQWKDDKSALAMIDKLAVPHKFKDAVRWNCYQCMGGEKAGVKMCTKPSCAFYKIRPWQ